MPNISIDLKASQGLSVADGYLVGRVAESLDFPELSRLELYSVNNGWRVSMTLKRDGHDLRLEMLVIKGYCQSWSSEDGQTVETHVRWKDCKVSSLDDWENILLTFRRLTLTWLRKISRSLTRKTQKHWEKTVSIFVDGRWVLKAPFRAMLKSVPVKVGDKVVCDQILAELEAMKMIQPLPSKVDGEVIAIYKTAGELVDDGTSLVEIVPVKN